MVGLKIFVEGGGDTKTLRTACREGFSSFLEKAGLKGYMPRIIACGGRQNAYDDFCTAITHNELAMLLVDSESPVHPKYQVNEFSRWNPWGHLENRKGDNWNKLDNVSADDCHLMVQCMETWFLADRSALESFYGKDFNAKALPAMENSIEEIDKEQIYQALEAATRNCEKKGSYDKGKHSFKLLAAINPALVVSASPWAERFIDLLKKRQGIL
jgi:hypothetical protein